MLSAGREYEIRELDHIKIKSEERDTIGFLAPSKKFYVDLKNTTHFSDVNIRVYSVKDVECVESLRNMIDENGLLALLVDSKGNLSNEVDRDKAFELLRIATKMNKLSDVEKEKISIISEEAARVCSQVFKVSKKSQYLIQGVLKEFIAIELVRDCIDERKVVTRKSGEFIDYKLNRILKFLDMKINVSKMRDFAIEYNRECINVNGEEYLRLEKSPSKTHVSVVKAKTK